MAIVCTNQRRIVHQQQLQSSGLRSAEIQIPFTPSEHSSPSCKHWHPPKRPTSRRPHAQSCVEGTNCSYPPRTGPGKRICEISSAKEILAVLKVRVYTKLRRYVAERHTCIRPAFRCKESSPRRSLSVTCRTRRRPHLAWTRAKCPADGRHNAEGMVRHSGRLGGRSPKETKQQALAPVQPKARDAAVDGLEDGDGQCSVRRPRWTATG